MAPGGTWAILQLRLPRICRTGAGWAGGQGRCWELIFGRGDGGASQIIGGMLSESRREEGKSVLQSLLMVDLRYGRIDGKFLTILIARDVCETCELHPYLLQTRRKWYHSCEVLDKREVVCANLTIVALNPDGSIMLHPYYYTSSLKMESEFEPQMIWQDLA